ncbi:MAG: hypothetical protein QG596_1548 [Actinomycetota bacterium]|jgi:hypothetical protein|nr:hypothetical protein [Actinomycetota bacterium]
MSGDSAAFAFVSRWELKAERLAVWDALVDFNEWPVWWPGLEKVIETIHGDDEGIGQKATATWRGPVGYTLNMAIEAVEKVQPDFLRGVATGDVVGEGTWQLGNTDDAWTSIEFDWNVRANRKWMEFLAPVARPLFVSSHDHVMKEGAEGLATHLSCDLRSFHASVD